MNFVKSFQKKWKKKEPNPRTGTVILYTDGSKDEVALEVYGSSFKDIRTLGKMPTLLQTEIHAIEMWFAKTYTERP